MLNTTRGATPLYLQISARLREKIVEKVYEYGSTIPSEAELQKLYNVSRITARQAIQELEKEGLVERARGKGTIVTYRKTIEESLAKIRSFTDEMKERNMKPGTKSARISVVKSDWKLAQLFGIDRDMPIYCLHRVRTGDGVPIVVFQSYFSLSRNLPLDDSLYYGSLYALLAQRGIEPVRIQEKFDCMMPDQHLQDALEIAKHQPVLRRTRTSYDGEGTVLEYTISYYRADLYSYYVEIVK